MLNILDLPAEILTETFLFVLFALLNDISNTNMSHIDAVFYNTILSIVDTHQYFRAVFCNDKFLCGSFIIARGLKKLRNQQQRIDNTSSIYTLYHEMSYFHYSSNYLWQLSPMCCYKYFWESPGATDASNPDYSKLIPLQYRPGEVIECGNCYRQIKNRDFTGKKKGKAPKRHWKTPILENTILTKFCMAFCNGMQDIDIQSIQFIKPKHIRRGGFNPLVTSNITHQYINILDIDYILIIYKLFHKHGKHNKIL